MLDSIKEHTAIAFQWVASGSKLTYAAIAVGVLVGLVLFRLFFKSVAGFFHSVGFSCGSGGNPAVAAKPGLCSSSRVKLFLIALVPAASGYAAYMLLPTFFPTLFK